jgi:tRNA(Arg) A34 adenosine deaminase TadA
MENLHEKFMKVAIELGRLGSEKEEGGPFGAIIVRENQIIGKGNNQVLLTNDPTAHAEVVAIRDACRNLNHFQLDQCILYTSCEPCPMCLGALYWARPAAIYYACTREDAASIGFDDHLIYDEILLDPTVRKIPAYNIYRTDGLKIFHDYQKNPNYRLY